VAKQDKPAGKALIVEIGPDTDHGFWVGVGPAERGKRGILVASQDIWKPGDEAQITLYLDGVRKPLKFGCSTLFHRPDPGDGTAFGVGLAFGAMAEQQMTALKSYFQRKKPDILQWNSSAGTLIPTSQTKPTAKTRKKLTLSLGPGTDNGVWMGFEEDIALGGIFVATQDVWERGEVVDVDLLIPGQRSPIAYECEVRWVREDMGDACAGIGLNWTTQPAEAKLGPLRRYVERPNVETIFWDE